MTTSNGPTSGNLLQESPVQPNVAHQFGMKRGRHQIALLAYDGPTVELNENLDLLTDGLDHGSPDEYRSDLSEFGYLQIRFEGVGLAPVAVPNDAEIHQTQKRVPVDHFLRHHDHPCTRPEHRHP